MTTPNPSFSHALPSASKVAAAKKKLEAAGVKYVLSCWIDLLGQPKTKPVPLSDFELLCMGKGPQFAVHSISFVPELGPSDSDQISLPDLDTLTICPWDRTCAWMIADLWWKDKPYNLCPRGTLKRAIADAADHGYAFHAGIEPEFIAMRWRDGMPVKAFDNDPPPGEGLRPRRQAFGYDVEQSVDAMPFLGDLIDILEEMGWNLHDVVAEGGYSQFELDFHYTDVLGMADRFVFLRILLKEIAKKHGIFITFMPKPTIGDWRSGAHMNISVRPTSDPERNLFEGENGEWHESVYHAADMCMNPYLSFSLSIAAMSEGMRNRLDPGKPINRDLYTMSEQEFAASGIQRLPRNLLESIEILRDDELAKQAMGETMHRSYLAYKVDEWERYHQEVTDWEVREYLRLF